MAKNKDDKCTLERPLCQACKEAVGRKRGPVSVNDMDEDALRWRKAGAEWAKSVKVRP